MKFAGIIAEYDPFHNGHAWQLAQAGRAAAVAGGGAGAGGAGLRSRPCVCPARALRLRRCRGFCPGGGAHFGCCRVRRTGLWGRDPGHRPAAKSRPGAVQRSIPHRAETAACRRGTQLCRRPAVQALCPGSDIAALLDKPNNNLAVEYCKAIIEQNVEMQPIALPRQGADHGQALTESAHAAFASASALRALWAEGGAAALAPYVPEKALKLYKQAEYDGKYTDFAVMGHCELALLRAACAGQAPFAAVRGVSEGLEHRLENAVRETASLPTLLDALTTVRYPRARMRRLAMDAALGYTAQTPALPPYLHLLGARKEALSLPGETALPLSHSLARLARENESCAQMAAAQSRASDLGALCRAKPEPMGGIYRQKIIFLTN